MGGFSAELDLNLNESSKNIIMDLYRDDFRFFGYDYDL